MDVQESCEGTSPWMGQGTSPWKDEVESRLERRPRTIYDCMDAGGRATHGFEHGSSYFAEPMDGRERFSCRGDKAEKPLSRAASGTAAEMPESRKRALPLILKVVPEPETQNGQVILIIVGSVYQEISIEVGIPAEMIVYFEFESHAKSITLTVCGGRGDGGRHTVNTEFYVSSHSNRVTLFTLNPVHGRHAGTRHLQGTQAADVSIAGIDVAKLSTQPASFRPISYTQRIPASVINITMTVIIETQRTAHIHIRIGRRCGH